MSDPAKAALAQEAEFTGQMTWPCICGHPKGDHYFGDSLMDGRMHTWCQLDPGHCQDFRPAEAIAAALKTKPMTTPAEAALALIKAASNRVLPSNAYTRHVGEAYDALLDVDPNLVAIRALLSPEAQADASGRQTMTKPWTGCIDCAHEHENLPDDPRCNAPLPVSDYRNGPEYCEHIIYADVLALVKRRQAEAAAAERERLRGVARAYHAASPHAPYSRSWEACVMCGFTADILADPEAPTLEVRGPTE